MCPVHSPASLPSARSDRRAAGLLLLICPSGNRTVPTTGKSPYGVATLARTRHIVSNKLVHLENSEVAGKKAEGRAVSEFQIVLSL